MNDDDMTPADTMSAAELHEDDQRAEFAQDDVDEARAAEEAKTDAAGESPDDDGECCAEFIDGSYTYCGCEECDERQDRDGEEQ